MIACVTRMNYSSMMCLSFKVIKNKFNRKSFSNIFAAITIFINPRIFQKIRKFFKIERYLLLLFFCQKNFGNSFPEIKIIVEDQISNLIFFKVMFPSPISLSFTFFYKIRIIGHPEFLKRTVLFIFVAFYRAICLIFYGSLVQDN